MELLLKDMKLLLQKTYCIKQKKDLYLRERVDII